ncbi:hypothetical protein HDU96_003401 [Phlyctochytrium bullatum]|nr:hypothetical protein HDU96_003401 [Phlyctochytrium bullatum]
MQITFYSMPFRRQFKANLCSQATVLALFLVCLTVIAPLLWAMVTQSFWLKENSFREQPSVLFMKDLLFVLEGTTGTSGDTPLALFYSNNPDLNSLFEDGVRAVPTIKTAELDFDRDGIFDQLVFNISMPLLPTDRIYRVRVALMLRYELMSRFRLKMQTLAVADQATPLPAHSLYLDGDLRLFQRGLLDTDSDNIVFDVPIVDFFGVPPSSPAQNWPSSDTSGSSAVQTNTSAVRRKAQLDISATDVRRSAAGMEVLKNGAVVLANGVGEIAGTNQAWGNVISAFLDRNVRTTFEVSQPLWQHPRAAAQPFVLSGRVRFPEEKVLYRPGAFEVIKFAWMQYLAHAVVVGVLCRWVFVWAIRCQVVPTYVVVDVLPRHHQVKGNLASGFKAYPF